MSEATPSPLLRRRPRVLVVDDSQLVLDLIQRVGSRRHGWDMRCALSGREAIEILAASKDAAADAWRADVVVCDLRMPGMDGNQVVSRVAELDRTLPVVIYSDESDLSRVLDTVHKGAFDFIPKSDDLDALAAAVTRAAWHGHLLREHQRLARELRALNQALEQRVAERTAQLEDVNRRLQASLEELTRAQKQMVASEKFVALGQLAAGVAHEMNTPVQYIGDSITFLGDAFGALQTLAGGYRACCESAAARGPAATATELARLEEEADLAYLVEEMPKALDRSRDGVSRAAAIVRAMKEFAHPGQSSKEPADVNAALRRTLTMARNEVAMVADLEVDLGTLPAVSCNIGEINQVFLNLVINACHAIADHARGDAGGEGGERGHITVRTRAVEGAVVVEVADTGVGIPEGIRERIFDPFFTTKEVGRGSGIGLALARAVIVDKHGGGITFDTQVGKGTTFRVTLPA